MQVIDNRLNYDIRFIRVPFTNILKRKEFFMHLVVSISNKHLKKHTGFVFEM